MAVFLQSCTLAFWGDQGQAAEAESGKAAPWETVSEEKGLTIYNRTRDGSPIKEFKAVGMIDALPLEVRNVLDDAEEYPHFMPYVKETKVISRKPEMAVTYQRLAPPLVGERDYTVRVHRETRHGAQDALSFFNRWEAANEAGPAEKPGVVRVKLNEGSWLLEPGSGGAGTSATYCVYCDSAGNIPAMLANRTSSTAIRRIFEAIRKQVKLPKYAARQP